MCGPAGRGRSAGRSRPTWLPASANPVRVRRRTGAQHHHGDQVRHDAHGSGHDAAQRARQRRRPGPRCSWSRGSSSPSRPQSSSTSTSAGPAHLGVGGPGCAAVPSPARTQPIRPSARTASDVVSGGDPPQPHLPRKEHGHHLVDTVGGQRVRIAEIPAERRSEIPAVHRRLVGLPAEPERRRTRLRPERPALGVGLGDPQGGQQGRWRSRRTRRRARRGRPPAAPPPARPGCRPVRTCSAQQVRLAQVRHQVGDRPARAGRYRRGQVGLGEQPDARQRPAARTVEALSGR